MDLEARRTRSEEPEEVGELMDGRASRPVLVPRAHQCADQQGGSEEVGGVRKMVTDCRSVRGDHRRHPSCPLSARSEARSAWPCTTTNAGFGFFKKKEVTPRAPGDDWDNVQRRKALVKLVTVSPAVPDGCDVAAEVEAAAGTLPTSTSNRWPP